MTDRNPDIMYGGQAVIEGVMMRGPRVFAVACRRTSGEITLRAEEVRSYIARWRGMKLPFLRGTFMLLDALILGTKALMWSGSLAQADLDAEAKAKKEAKKAGLGPGGAILQALNTVTLGALLASPSGPEQPKRNVINDIAIGVTLPLGLALGVFLFVVVPNWVAAPLKNNQLWYNLVEGLLRITIFTCYIWLIGLAPDVKRLFQYHGAEHRAINTFESGLDLTMENTRQFSIKHVRCGTAFIVLVLLISILVFTFLPLHPPGYLSGKEPWYIGLLWRAGTRLALLPVVAGIAYEAIRYAGKRKDTSFTKIFITPGLWFQSLTTREPDDSHVVVALTSLQAVLDEEAKLQPA
jgi:uncharacterized protein YqhQ